MHVSCIQAGTLLARLGRPEVKSCIDGLEQYSCSYEEAGEQALEMGRIFTQALAGEPQFSHMGMAVPRSSPDSMGGDDQDMDVSSNHVQSHVRCDSAFSCGALPTGTDFPRSTPIIMRSLLMTRDATTLFL